MIATEKKSNDFLIMFDRFCENIDKYNGIFGIDNDLLNSIKSETFFLHDFYKDVSVDASHELFVYNRLNNVKTDLNYATQLCKNNNAYTLAIGADLGIEPLAHCFKLSIDKN